MNHNFRPNVHQCQLMYRLLEILSFFRFPLAFIKITLHYRVSAIQLPVISIQLPVMLIGWTGTLIRHILVLRPSVTCLSHPEMPFFLISQEFLIFLTFVRFPDCFYDLRVASLATSQWQDGNKVKGSIYVFRIENGSPGGCSYVKL